MISNFSKVFTFTNPQDILLIMFARLTSISIALVAMIGVVSANNNACPLKLVCCQNAGNVSRGFLCR